MWHRCDNLRDPDVVKIGQLRVTSLTRTMVDVASVLDRASFESVLDDALARRRTSIKAVGLCFDRSGLRGRRGFAMLREVLDERDGGLALTESELERRFVRLLKRTGIELPVLQLRAAWLVRVNGRVDAAWPKHRYLVEVNGRKGHARPMGPDAMATAAGAIAQTARSYRQDGRDAALPSVVVELPSGSDNVLDFSNKVRRWQRLGVVVYAAYVSPAEPYAERYAPGQLGARPWFGEACPELGGLSFEGRDGRLVVRASDGIVAGSVSELRATFEQLAEAERERAEAERERADTAEARAARLAAQLHAAGVEPEG